MGDCELVECVNSVMGGSVYISEYGMIVMLVICISFFVILVGMIDMVLLFDVIILLISFDE